MASIKLASFFLCLSLAAALSSCKKNVVIDETKEISKAPLTNDSITVNDLTVYNSNAPSRGEYHLLGYGYDVTGEYADSSSARQPIIDLVRLKKDWPTRLETSRSTSSWPHVYATDNAAEFARQLSTNVIDSRFFGLKDQDYKRYFKGEIVNYFQGTNALSSKFIYGCYSHQRIYKTFYFACSLSQYAFPSFHSDVETHTPAELVKKYGTHILTRINLGTKLTVIYQAETEQADREEAAKLGLTVSLGKIFGMFSGYLDHWQARSAGNFAQRVSFKVTGGDISKLKTIINPETKSLTLDTEAWVQSSTVGNSELINIQEIAPIYEAITNLEKKAAVKKYIEDYLVENAVVNLK